ncbi:MAG: ACP S-malonyltransferase [Chitinispirillales bacterium]|jgi:[acyl-carrier-protein] S-malonyltransferase|nr:ACP S-malonyltransferase [Chitinispirillales bacterium]
MTREILFQLPGQGSHFFGMGADLQNSGNVLFRELLEIGSETIKKNLQKVIFGDESSEFNDSKILQPTIAAVSLSFVKILEDEGISPSMVMGHSLGEITALGVAGSLSFQKAVEFAAFRGKLMDESAKLCGGGTMTAVLLASGGDCQKIIEEMDLQNTIFVANDNAPTQAVVSGKSDDLSKFEKYIEQKMRVKTKRIAVAGPWHTPFIQHAKQVFSEWVKDKEILPPKCKFVMNQTAKEENNPEKIRELITDQFVKPVRWRESCEYIKNMKFSAIIEVGPGKILAGLMRANKIIKSTDFHGSVSSVEEAKTIKGKIAGEI